MKSILLVKTSSLGDVVHNLPVVGDIRSAYPHAGIDWVVEEAFAAIPRMHPAVRTVIPVAVRRWRSQWWRGHARDEIRAFLQRLRGATYDAVIDTQGLLKSALIAAAARGARYGLDWRSAREPLRLFYDRTFNVPWTLHAVERNRSLAAQALDYAASSRVDYGIHGPSVELAWAPQRRYAVLLHATSAERKLWPETDWVGVGRYFLERGACSVLPWGNAVERGRSTRLAAQLRGALVPAAMRLDEVAALLAGAHAVVGVDTGLTHLAAALGVPTVGIYCATDPAATGIYGCLRAVNAGGRDRAPPAGAVISALQQLAI
jgi:heptosyltransferase-1